MSEKAINLLRKKYGFSKGSYKYILPGSEIFKYIGQVVYRIKFTKSEEGEWSNELEPAIITNVGDFDPTSMSYTCKYVLDSDPETTLEEKIIPEGFSLWIPEEGKEEATEFIRFIPRSTHWELVEDEMFHTAFLPKVYEKPSLSIDELRMISDSKSQEEILKYAHNIGLLIKNPETGEYFYARIQKLKLTHRQGTKYSLYLADDVRHWNFLIDTSNASGEYDYEIAGFKFKISSLTD